MVTISDSLYWYILYCVMIVNFRGEDFCVAFAQIGELCSIVPDHVKVLALTGTATPEVVKAVRSKLSWNDIVIVGISPARDNIKYYVEPLPKLAVLSKFFSEHLLSK